MSDETTLLQSLSKLKKAGKLRYWRGTIEIPEIELHAICDEIQAEYDNAVHALNKAAGNWAKADAELREKGDMAMARATDELRKSLDFMRIWISEDAHLGESAISRELEKAEGLRKLDAIEQAVAATLRSESVDYMLNTIGKLEEENERLQNSCGTLTAEQVEKAIHDCSTYASYDGCTYYASGIRLQAIADELNAELGSGTCELTETDSYSNANEVIHVLECSECGETCEHVNGSYPRCPHCGKKAVKR